MALIPSFIFGIFSTILGIASLSHAFLTLGYRTYQPVGPTRGWIKECTDKHRRELLDGIQKTVERRAMDGTAPEWTPADCNVGRHSDNEVEDFAAWVLEFFDTYARSGAEETILSLMSDRPRANHIFGLCLHRLLKICVQGAPALTEEQHRRCLRICLEWLWRWAKAYSQSSASLPSYFPLPSPDMIRRLQAEPDPTAAIIAQCFSALVAKKLAADVDSRHSSDVRVHDTKLESLSAILCRTRPELETFLIQSGAVDLANIPSLASSVLKTLFTEEVLSTDVLGIFRGTVDTLLAEDSLTSLDAKLPQSLYLLSTRRIPTRNDRKPLIG